MGIKKNMDFGTYWVNEREEKHKFVYSKHTQQCMLSKHLN